MPRQPEEDLGKLTEFVGDACFVVSPDGAIVATNDRALRLYGYERDELLGRPATQLCTELGEWLFATALHRWAVSSELFDLEQRRKSGDTFIAELCAKDCVGMGYPGFAVVTMREVTELRECQEDLELKSLMLDGSLDAVLVHKPNGELVYFNQAAADALQMSMEDYSRLEPWGWVAPTERSNIAERLGELRRSGEMRFESTTLRKDGTVAHSEVHARLVDTLQGALIIAITRDITERVKAHEYFEHLAYHDPLTGLPNRTYVEQRLAAATAYAERHGDSVGVIFIDLDDFKPVNDRHGHAVGDAVLRVIAERMESCVREYDVVARLGGDEFLVLLPRLLRREDLAVIAFKVVRAVCEPIEIDPLTIDVSASVGLAVYEPGEALDELINRADAEMYRAKQQRLPGWEVFLGENQPAEEAS